MYQWHLLKHVKNVDDSRICEGTYSTSWELINQVCNLENYINDNSHNVSFCLLIVTRILDISLTPDDYNVYKEIIYVLIK